jgi:hypothetical protein
LIFVCEIKQKFSVVFDDKECEIWDKMNHKAVARRVEEYDLYKFDVVLVIQESLMASEQQTKSHLMA